MIIQKSFKKNVVHKRFLLGAHPIIQFFINKMTIPEILSSYFQHDSRIKLSTEKTLTVLIHNILTARTPLYELIDWTKPIDEEALGLDLNDYLLLNDDRTGKALNTLFNSKHKDIFFRLALRAIKLFELDCRQIHQDTTTVTFHGKYNGWNHSPFIKHGINKDHRPDLKQLVLGMSVTADGSIPLVHQIYDGNQTDDRLHINNHKRIRKLLQKSDFIYVADCKLATAENLRKISECGGLFVTVMPKTWKENEIFLNKVITKKIKWDFLLSKPDNRKPKSKRDRYYLACAKNTTSQGYRLLWIKSTQKAELDSEIRQRNINKSIEILKQVQVKLNKYSLKTYDSIKKKITEVLKEHSCDDLIDYSIDKRKEQKKVFATVGRPKSNDSGKIISKKYFTISFQINKKNIKKQSLTDGIFPLLTNLIENKKNNPKKILEIYKYQPFLEKRHSQLKTYQNIAPVFLKKPERVIAYLHTQVMALMVATLIERQLRLAMKKNLIESLFIYPETRKCKYPTMYDIVRLFQNVERYEVCDNENIVVFPAELTKLQKQVLKLLEVPVSLYH